MEISVIIPSYKPGKYLWDCLNSLKKQTFRESDYEILLILNGCNEPYYSNIYHYVDINFPNGNLRLFQVDSSGVSNARNIGINNSIGQYICFIDDDDVVSSNYLSSLYSVSSPICVGCANSFDFSVDINEISKNFISERYLRCIDRPYSQFQFRGFLSPPWAKLIHRKIIGETRFNTKLAYSEDSVFCVNIAPRIKDMKLSVEDCVYYVRRREGSATQQKFSFKKGFSQLLRIEWCYFHAYINHPKGYEFKFIVSRLFAGVKNTFGYFLRDFNR